MTVTTTISMERLHGLDLHQGDTLRVLSVKDSGVLVQIDRAEPAVPLVHGKASQWLREARGSVHLSEGETAEDVRTKYYAEKYDLES